MVLSILMIQTSKICHKISLNILATTWVNVMVNTAWLLLLLSCMWVAAVVLKSVQNINVQMSPMHAYLVHDLLIYRHNGSYDVSTCHRSRLGIHGNFFFKFRKAIFCNIYSVHVAIWQPIPWTILHVYQLLDNAILNF